MEEMVVVAITKEEAEEIHAKRVEKAKQMLIQSKAHEMARLLSEIKQLGGKVIHAPHEYVGAKSFEKVETVGKFVYFK